MSATATLTNRRPIEGPLEPLPQFRVRLRYPRPGRDVRVTLWRGATEADALIYPVKRGLGAADGVERLPLAESTTFAWPRRADWTYDERGVRV